MRIETTGIFCPRTFFKQSFITTCTGSRGRIISIITNKPGSWALALATGTVAGIALVWAIPKYYPEQYLEKFREKRWYIIVAGAFAMGASALFALAGKIQSTRAFLFSLFTTGMVSGLHYIDVCNRVESHRIEKYKVKYRRIEELIEKDIGSAFTTYIDAGLDLGEFIKDLRDLSESDLIELGEKILSAQQRYLETRPHSHEKPTVIFKNFQVADNDLKRLGRAGWFGYFERINLSHQHSITSQGIIAVCQGNYQIIKELLLCVIPVDAIVEIIILYCRNENPQTLNLHDTHLTDGGLKELAHSGYFYYLERLIISDNPLLTGKGLAWVAEKGFEGLKVLDISENPELIKEGLTDWMEKNGLKSLETIYLCSMDIEEVHLEQMIEKSEWFRGLKGINLANNKKLKKLPDNLYRLKDIGITYLPAYDAGAPIYYQDSGIYLRGCHINKVNPTHIKFRKEEKIYGGLG